MLFVFRYLHYLHFYYYLRGIAKLKLAAFALSKFDILKYWKENYRSCRVVSEQTVFFTFLGKGGFIKKTENISTNYW